MSAVTERVSSINKAAIDRGYRFGWTGNDCRWYHRLELPEGFVDLTDLDDAEFDEFIKSKSAQESAQ